MYKIPSKPNCTLELEATLEAYVGWEVSVTDDPDPIFSFTPPAIVRTIDSDGRRRWKRSTAVHSVFAVRDALLRVDDTSAALTLFKMYGPLRLIGINPPQANDVSLSEVRDLRARRGEFLLWGSTRKDFRRTGLQGADLSTMANIADAEAGTAPAVNLIARGDFLIGVIRSGDIQEASRIAVYLDRLSGHGWAKCEECAQPYKKTSKHKRKYCSPQCLSYATTQTNLKPGVPPARRRKTTRRTNSKSIH